MRGFIKKSFKRELLMCFIIVALLPLVLSSAFLIQMFKVKLDRDYRKQDLERAAVVGDKLDELFRDLEETARVLAKDDQIIASMSEGNGLSGNAVYSRLYGVSAELRELAEFALYSREGICLYSTGRGMIHSRLPDYWGILKVAAAHPDEMIIRRDKEYISADDSDVLLRTARAILNEQSECIGYVTASMRGGHFDKALMGSFGSQEGICIVDSFWETVYSAGTAGQEAIGDVLRGRMMSGKSPFDTYRNNRIYISALGDTGLYSVFLRPEVFTTDATRAMYSVLMAMAAASLLLCIVVAAAMSNNLTQPVKNLNSAMRKVQQGEWETRIESDREDELGQLSASFNTMVRELKEYMDNQVRQQKELNEVSIAMMQAQLNPHFLYNTLDTMKWVAKANHIPEIATLAAKLAKILRASISQAQFIRLSEEMELVESYVQIQQIRFGGKFTFTCELPEPLRACMVPKLIVQPIVENAVIHGLEDCDEGSITVRAYEWEGVLYIEVSDDGCGISEEVMEHLNSREREKMAGHIGFCNVDTIIRLHYGEEYGLKVDRPEEGGTKVTIAIPARREETHAEGNSD